MRQILSIKFITKTLPIIDGEEPFLKMLQLRL